MLIVFRNLMFLALLALSHQVMAVSELSKHSLSVSQSMSAFYMYSLSEGDTRYQDQFKKYLSQAEQHLVEYQKQEPQKALELRTHWERFSSDLKFEYVDGAGFTIPLGLRLQYRKYLELVYKKTNEIIRSEANVAEQLFYLSLSVEIMAARFFDVASAPTGAMTLGSGLLIDPVKMAGVFNERVQALLKMPIDKSVKGNLKAIKRKWQFIEETVTVFKQETAYLLVYYNKDKISKLLNKSQVVLAGL